MILQKNYKGNEVKYIDVAASEDAKKKMRDLSGNQSAVPPQIFNGDTYCGVRVKHGMHPVLIIFVSGLFV